MTPKKFIGTIGFFLAVMLSNTSGAFVGVNIGTAVSNMQPASGVVALLKALQLTHVRLYDADAHMLNALSNSKIEVTVGIRNEELLGVGQSTETAAAWVNKNVAAYLPSTKITAIAVGSEVFSQIPHAASELVPAMNNLHKALVATNLNFQVKVSTPLSIDVIQSPFPPSTANFNSYWNSTMYQVLQFLKNTNSFFMLNAYPYYEYIKSNGIFPIDYALFRPLPSVKQIVDPNSLLHYGSMFDAMVDAAYYSMQSLNFSDIPIVVTESGWPSYGGPDATVENAETYNSNLIRRVLNDSGTPFQPNKAISAYIYELFNEDERPGPESLKNWGLCFPNGTHVYPLSLGSSNGTTGNSSVIFCVAKQSVASEKLRQGLDWACGHGADCGLIKPGKPCYSDDLWKQASYAYNDYYQKMKSVGGTCDFSGTATNTTENPSYGSCTYTGSSNWSSSGGALAPAESGPAITGESSTRHVPLQPLILTILVLVWL